jgi:hypothetical protein
VLTSALPKEIAEQAGKNVDVAVLSAEEFAKQTGSKTGNAVTKLVKGEDGVLRAQVFVKEGADPSVLLEEAAHVAQLSDPKLTPKLAKLTEDNLANWPKMSTQQRLDVYKTKIELEIDAQQRLLQQFAKGDPAYAKGVQHNLDNLQSRLAEVDLGVKNPKSVAKEPWLRESQPPRLFSKSGLSSKQVAERLTSLSPDAQSAVKSLKLSDDETLKVAELLGDNKEVTNDLLRQYLYKMRKAERKGDAFERPKDIGEAIQSSLDNFNIVKQRGYPFGFDSIQQYQGFKENLTSALERYNIPLKDVRIQGSSVHKTSPGDIDIAILVDKAEFEALGQRFINASTKDNIKKAIPKDMGKGKISSQRFAPGEAPSVGQSIYGQAGDLDFQTSLILKNSEFDIGPYLPVEY